MTTPNLPAIIPIRRAWNRGRIIGQKRPLQPKHVWAIRVRLELAGNIRDLALFNLAVDSKLRGCDLVQLSVADVFAAGRVKERTSILQSKTNQPVQFEITADTRISLKAWIAALRDEVNRRLKREYGPQYRRLNDEDLWVIIYVEAGYSRATRAHRGCRRWPP